ncbi:AAA domain-containing protein [Streptococcus thermophilus]|uniref:ATP-dependent Clp protease ATP-binding subunit n=1 Tax=Streptococcus thermophilus TaxID=1308 RepID=UPI0023035C6B|nr:ATP-dependent Clp protease ATP-binding subunit [Streptococcus thermophilus]MCE2158970.1 AAA domain-containing protein [Streptococcus thermophilus]MCE2168929.1 AAA domain-containing protein [Streptococcus thermophilus]MCE2175401.1 AAA domain-containing protein [Streptococcus thermophilus]MCE2188318.1 AAA domain-containing protein [Streptococcus thermophilus]MCE2273675.1 AAA domain-containing protein [Streptococcus thermophilus]
MTIYSRKMQAIFHRAQLEAERFESPFLETWHVLLAMVEVPGSVAYLTFTDFEDRIHSEEIETAAVLAMEKRPKDLSESDIIDLRAQSPALEAMLQEAQGIASVTGAVEVGSEHVLMAFLLHKDLMVCRLLEVAGFQYKDDSDKPRIIDLRRSLEHNAGLSKQDLKAIHDLRKPKKSKASANFANMMQPPQSSTGELADYTKDLTALAESGNLDPIIGRDEEISRMIQVLSRKTKNNPVLVGEAGVGKTALALGLAQRIASGEVPFELADMRILELDMMSVVAGTRFRGDFEERMNQIIDEIEADGKIILFIDELHTIIGSGSGIDSTLDAANILKPALARGTLHMVGATTQAEYQKHIEKDAALSRRFAKITIEEPSVSEAIDILNGLRSSYEDYHRVTITDAAVETAVKAAHRYLTSKNLPDSAIDLLDEASATVQVRIKKEAKREITPLDEALISGDIGAAVKQYKANQKAKFPKPALVDADQIMQTLSRLSGIPVEKMTQTDSKRYLNLESELHKRVIGQDEAVSAISRAIRRNQSGIRTGKRPIGSFMFLGPTGVGKTELAKALAEVLFDDESALLRFDMSEYMEKFAASRLNGAPPGYVGYDEGGELTEKVRNKPYSVLLFDEIEKAHPDIFNILLQVLDDGVLTDSRGRKVDFSNTIIIMTSNLGATALRDDKTVGFGAQTISHNHQAMQARIMEELKKSYRPEFINRIDEKVVFHSLEEEQLHDIVKIMVKPLISALADKGISLKFQPAALKHLAKDGYDIEMGARPLRRTIQTQVEDKLSELLLGGQVVSGQTLKIGCSKDKLTFTVV